MGFWKDGDDYYKEFNEMWAKRCCETCKHFENEGACCECCLKEYFGHDSGIRFDKMKCDEWEAR